MVTELLGSYLNGNYKVKIYSDGTKIRFTKDSYFMPKFPESIDLKITNYCDNGCSYCHENSSLNGKRAWLGFKFFDTLTPGTELAIGGGNPLSHPDLKDFLFYMRDIGVICNLTVHQRHFVSYFDYLCELTSLDLIRGIGVSYDSYIKGLSPNIVSDFGHFPNLTIHIINGVVSYKDLERFFDKNLKLLVLGYKDIRRGRSYNEKNSKKIKKNQLDLESNIIDMFDKFKVVSFDNLALQQLNIRDKVMEDDWNVGYMGDDGVYTMYIDLVEEEFASSSVSKIRYSGMMESIEDMFDLIRTGS